MPSMTIKNIPEDLYEAHRKMAERHHHSINSEVIVSLKRVLLADAESPEERLARIRDLRKKLKGALPPGEIDRAIDEGRP